MTVCQDTKIEMQLRIANVLLATYSIYLEHRVDSSSFKSLYIVSTWNKLLGCSWRVAIVIAGYQLGVDEGMTAQVDGHFETGLGCDVTQSWFGLGIIWVSIYIYMQVSVSIPRQPYFRFVNDCT